MVAPLVPEVRVPLKLHSSGMEFTTLSKVLTICSCSPTRACLAVVACRVVSHLFTGGLAGIGKLPALVGWYIWYGITAYTNFLPL
jgi:hypothetical protein